MSKTLKMSILLIIIALGCLFLTQTKVDAVEINSVDELREAFEGKSATINGTTITLTGDVEFLNPYYSGSEYDEKYDDVTLGSDDDYILNLNGHKLSVAMIGAMGKSLTVNDTNGTGKITGAIFIGNESTVIVNNGTINDVMNNGNLTVNNGTITKIFNVGTLVIEDGNFGGVEQDGNATIKGGTFTAKVWNDGIGELTACTGINLSSRTTVIAGGEFNKGDLDYAIKLYDYSSDSINQDAINALVPDGYKAIYDGYMLESSHEINYYSLKVIKDESNEIFNKVAPNGVWTVNSVKPKTSQDADFLLNAMAGDIEVPKGYKFLAYGSRETFNPETGTLMLTYGGSIVTEKNVKVVYNEPSITIQNKVNSVLDVISKHTNGVHSEETGFRIEDLYLINFLNASTKGMDSSLALNFAKDLIQLTKGSNMSYKFDERLGAWSPGLWSYTGGQVTVYYEGIAVNTTKIGLTRANVLYVPNETANTDSARIQAALKRIKDYLGTTEGITIEVGGTLASLGDWNEHNFIDEEAAGSNYYNVTINGRTYKFAICKKDSSKLETPEYLASDILSNIRVKSSSSELPLDTAITVKSVTSDNIKKALGTNAYVAYDISLYSNAKQVNITKLKDGKFTVSIPVPEILKGKEITVYYINSNGEKEEHTATVKDGVASFETNHFSTYALAESKDNTDNTENNTEDANIGNTDNIGNNTEDANIGNTDNTGNNTEDANIGNTDSDKNNNSQVVDNDNNTESNNSDNTSNNPQTGDNILLFIGIAFIAIVAIITTTKLKKYYKIK